MNPVVVFINFVSFFLFATEQFALVRRYCCKILNRTVLAYYTDKITLNKYYIAEKNDRNLELTLLLCLTTKITIEYLWYNPIDIQNFQNEFKKKISQTNYWSSSHDICHLQIYSSNTDRLKKMFSYRKKTIISFLHSDS